MPACIEGGGRERWSPLHVRLSQWAELAQRQENLQHKNEQVWFIYACKQQKRIEVIMYLLVVELLPVFIGTVN